MRKADGVRWEIGFLLDLFRTSPEKIQIWERSDRATRRKLFDPVKVREALDERDGDVERKRQKEYTKLSGRLIVA
jgi:hypothetical protein